MTNRISSVLPHLPLAGLVLVSTNQAKQSPLTGAVCLVLHHEKEGSMGLILNRELDHDLDSLWKVLKAPKGSSAGSVRFGGPFSGPILALHCDEQLAEALAGAGVYVAAHLDKLQQLASAPSAQVRFVIGQLQWSPGELEQEIAQGHWLPMPATPELVFAPEDEMWGRGMREAGNRFVTMVSGSVPTDNAWLN